MPQQRKDPAEETGTFSVHNSGDDKEIIQMLGWEGVGGSKIWTRGLEASEELENLRRTYDRFLSGDITLGQLMRRLNRI